MRHGRSLPDPLPLTRCRLLHISTPKWRDSLHPANCTFWYIPRAVAFFIPAGGNDFLVIFPFCPASPRRAFSPISHGNSVLWKMPCVKPSLEGGGAHAWHDICSSRQGVEAWKRRPGTPSGARDTGWNPTERSQRNATTLPSEVILPARGVHSGNPALARRRRRGRPRNISLRVAPSRAAQARCAL